MGAAIREAAEAVVLLEQDIGLWRPAPFGGNKKMVSRWRTRQEALPVKAGNTVRALPAASFISANVDQLHTDSVVGKGQGGNHFAPRIKANNFLFIFNHLIKFKLIFGLCSSNVCPQYPLDSNTLHTNKPEPKLAVNTRASFFYFTSRESILNFF